MAEIKSREWLKSRFETGDIPTGEDYERLLDSYWHKNETGTVAEGEEYLVTGKAVYEALQSLYDTMLQKMKEWLGENLPELLQQYLQNYVDSAALNAALEDRPTTAWMQRQLEAKATLQAVQDALADKVNNGDIVGMLTSEVLDDALEDMVTHDDLSDALASKANANDVYSKKAMDQYLSSRPSEVIVAGSVSQNIATLATKVNELVQRTNTLSHVACGSETMTSCPSNITEMTIQP